MKPTFTNVILFAFSFGFGQIIRNNPLLLALVVKSKNQRVVQKKILKQIFLEHPVLDAALELHRNEIGQEEWTLYRNHCLRVLSFATHNTTITTNEREVSIMALAVAYHDIALWTDQKLNYVEPSIAVMVSDQHQCRSNGDTVLQFTEDELEMASQMIRQHHKVTEWKDDSDERTFRLVNALRSADWCDTTLGVMDKGIPNELVLGAYRVLPSNGFHQAIAEMGAKSALVGKFDLFRIFKW